MRVKENKKKAQIKKKKRKKETLYMCFYFYSYFCTEVIKGTCHRNRKLERKLGNVYNVKIHTKKSRKREKYLHEEFPVSTCHIRKNEKENT